MEMKLGSKVIQLNRVSKISEVGHRIAQIRFKTGESICVICGVHTPEGALIPYPGTYEELKSFIEQHKESSISD